MKINKRIVIINILFLVFIFILLDYIAFCFLTNKENLTIKNKYPISLKAWIKRYNLKKHIDERLIFNTEGKKFRPVENINSSKKPILIFGCSFARGHNLKQNETFSYLFGKQTNRPIYNRALGGLSTNHMLYQLQNKEFYKIVPKPEYIIYIFIPSHISRLYGYNYLTPSQYQYSIFYKLKPTYTKNNIKLIHLKRDYFREILSSNSIYFLIEQQHYIKIKASPTNNNLNLLKLHILQSYIEVRKHWGKDVKFVILFYTTDNYIQKFKPLLKELKDLGFIIININELSDKDFLSLEYQISEKDSHPNAKAWEEITPLLIKKLNIK